MRAHVLIAGFLGVAASVPVFFAAMAFGTLGAVFATLGAIILSAILIQRAEQ